MRNTTTRVCPYEECDGTGIILYDRHVNVGGIETTRSTSKECKCYKEKIQSRKLQFAKIPKLFEQLTVNSFNTQIYSNQESKEYASRCKKLVGRYIAEYKESEEAGKGLFLYSTKRGSGKTRLAVSCANALIKTYGVNVRFTTVINLLDQIKETYNENESCSERELMTELCNIDVLILDDMGVEKATPWVEEKLYHLLDTRIANEKVTIITSNLSLDELRLDERIKSRLAKMVIQLKMPEEDIRRKLAEEENERLISRLLGEGL